MALTVFETTEQQQQLLHPCHQAGGGDGGKQAAAAAGGAEKAAAAMLIKETDHGGDDDRPERGDIWNMIQQAQKPPAAAAAPPRQQAQAAYVHPLVRRSSSLLTQKSLEICTESLGSETGSDGFSDADGGGSGTDRSTTGSDSERDEEVVVAAPRAPPPPPSRAFPPPLPSLARRKVESTMEMRKERQDGRLLVRVVPVPSSTLFRAQRRGGRLLLSFADTAAPVLDDDLLDTSRAHDQGQGQVLEPEPEQQALVDEEEDDEVEDEVEVVDRGTVVEFKVSAQPQPRSGSGRVHRSALVINKFVGAEPVTSRDIDDGTAAPAPPHAQHPAKHPRRSTGPTTTAVAALAAASALTAAAAPPGDGDGDGNFPGATCGENKLLMTAKRRSSKEDLLKHMRCCGQLSGPLFVWEGYIATSS